MICARTRHTMPCRAMTELEGTEITISILDGKFSCGR